MEVSRGSPEEEKGTTDAQIIKHLLEYLQLEGIVNTWRGEEILAFRQGLKAHEALQSLFEQVGTDLKDGEAGRYEAKVNMEGTGDGRPCLMIAVKSWEKIFGTDKDPKRLFVMYNSQKIPSNSQDAEAISFELSLWWPGGGQGGDWPRAKQKMKGWLQSMRNAGFRLAAYNRGWKSVQTDLLTYDFKDEPLYVCATGSAQTGLPVAQRELVAAQPEDLVRKLTQSARKCCEIVSSLK